MGQLADKKTRGNCLYFCALLLQPQSPSPNVVSVDKLPSILLQLLSQYALTFYVHTIYVCVYIAETIENLDHHNKYIQCWNSPEWLDNSDMIEVRTH